jgi:uncharacterized membrane protein YeiB
MTTARGTDRIVGYDLARSLALLGMIAFHFALVIAHDTTRPRSAAVIVGMLDGRAATLFVVLAGVGLTLRTRGGRPPGEVRRTLLRRGVFLLAFGFLNLTIWPGDILRVYGVSLLLAAWFLRASGRKLLLVAAFFVVVFLVLILAIPYDTNWHWPTLTYKNLWTTSGLVRNLFYDGFRSVFPWTGLLFFGMWLGRLDLRDRAINGRVLLAGVVGLLIAVTLSRLCLSYFTAHPGDMDAETVRAIFGLESLPPMPLFLLSGGSSAVVAIAACVRIGDVAALRAWLRPLVCTGQMALTWYVGHIVIGLGTVEALGLVQKETLPVAFASGLGFFVVAVGLSWWWKVYFRHGPLEWLMRKVAG